MKTILLTTRAHPSSVAFEYYRLASEVGGKADSISNLATMYKDGVGTDQDFAQALSLYEKAFDAGSDISGYVRGCCSRHLSLPPNSPPILNSQNLAAMHANGIGTSKDLFKARDILERIVSFQGAAEALAQVEQMIAAQTEL